MQHNVVPLPRAVLFVRISNNYSISTRWIQFRGDADLHEIGIPLPNLGTIHHRENGWHSSDKLCVILKRGIFRPETNIEYFYANYDGQCKLKPNTKPHDGSKLSK